MAGRKPRAGDRSTTDELRDRYSSACRLVARCWYASAAFYLLLSLFAPFAADMLRRSGFPTALLIGLVFGWTAVAYQTWNQNRRAIRIGLWLTVLTTINIGIRVMTGNGGVPALWVILLIPLVGALLKLRQATDAMLGAGLELDGQRSNATADPEARRSSLQQIEFRCEHCRANLVGNARDAGSVTLCSRCGGELIIPDAAPSPQAGILSHLMSVVSLERRSVS